MKTLDVKTIAQNLLVKTNKAFNTDLFGSDTEVIDNPNYLSEMDYYVSIDYSTMSDNNGEINGAKETFIALKDGDSFLVTIVNKVGFSGETEENIFSKWLKLKGFNYFAKKVIEDPNTEEGDIEVLGFMSSQFYKKEIEKDLKISVDYEDLLSIAEDKDNYLQVSFVDDNDIIKINFNTFGQLTSMKREIDQQKQKEDIRTKLFKRRGSSNQLNG